MADSVRHKLHSTDTMKKYFGEIEFMVFAAEVYCNKQDGQPQCNGVISPCPFRKEETCSLTGLRAIIGDHDI